MVSYKEKTPKKGLEVVSSDEKRREYQRLWREKNKIHKAAIDRAWYEANKDKKKAYDKTYNQVNRDKKLAQGQTWAEKNREKSREMKKRYSDKNRLKWRLYCYNRRNNMKVTGDNISLIEISNWESRVCGVCSELIEGKYHLDHIIPLSKNGPHVASNIQLTHPLCNLRKHNKLMPVGAI